MMFKKSPHVLKWLAVAWIVLICAIAFFQSLGSTGLVDETEPMFAEAARQINVTGNWVTLYYNEATRFDKPPLVYWLMAIYYRIFGVNTWAARLPSALSATALVGFGFYILQRFGFANPTAAKIPGKEGIRQKQLLFSAWIGSTLIAMNGLNIVWAHTAVSDMLLSACTGICLLCFFVGYTQETPEKGWLTIPNNWYLAFYIFAGLAVLTKGPVGIVIPGIIIFAFLIYMGSLWQVVKEMGVVVGGIIFLIVTVPWNVLVILENGQEYIDTFFGYHNVERFTSVVNNHSAPWYFYFLAVLIGFGPWSIYLPLAITRLKFWQRRFWQRQPRNTHLGIFALAWFATIFIFFTIAVTKIASYILPSISAAALIVALLWSEELTSEGRGKDNKGLLISGIFNVIFLFIVAGAIAYSPNYIGFDPDVPTLPAVFAASGLHILGAVIWITTAIATAVFLFRKTLWRWLWIPNLIGFTAFILFVLTPANSVIDEVRQLPLRQLAETVNQVRQPQEELVMIGFEKPTLVFYTQNPVEFFNSSEEARPYLESLDNSSVLLVGLPEKIADFEEGFDQEELDKRGSYELVRLLPQ